MLKKTGSNDFVSPEPRKLFIMPESENGMLSFSDITALLRRRIWLIFIIVVLGTAAGVIAANSIPDSYTASSTLVLERNDRRVLESDPTTNADEFNRVGIETEIDVMKSRGFGGQIVDEFKLVEDPYLNPYLQIPVDQTEKWYGESINSALSGLKETLGIGSGESEIKAKPDIAIQRDRTITSLLSKMSVGRSGESLAMSVTVTHPNAKGAADLANSITDFYVRRSFAIKQEENVSAIAILRGRAEGLAAEIAESEGRIAELRHTHQLEDEGDKIGDQLQAEARQLDVRLKLANDDLKKSEDQLAKLAEVLSSENADNTVTANDPAYAALLAHKKEENALLQERVRMAQVGEEGQTELVRVNTQLQNIRNKIRLEAERLRTSATRTRQLNSQKIAELESEARSLETRIQERNDAEISLSKLERGLLTDRERYNQILSGLSVLDLQSEILHPAARVVSIAEVPAEPSAPKRKLIIAAGFIGSGVFALVLVMLLEGLNNKIRSEQQTRQISRLPNLAYIPQIPRKLWEKSPPPHKYLAENNHSFFSEAIRSLYMACRRSGQNSPPQVVMVTSGLPSEGKTSISMCLAAVAATNGQRTVLVDLDLHRSGVSECLSFRGLDGSLEEFIEKDRPLQEIIHHSESVQGVDIICATKTLKQRSTLFSSERINDLFRQLRQEYDFIVVDTPPILVVSDGRWLTPLIDAAISVVRWGETTENVLNDAIERLRSDNVPLIGTVINRVNPRSHAKYGYGGSPAYYYYADGYYSG